MPSPQATVTSLEAEQEHEHSSHPLEGRILIVDDDEICTDLAQTVLEKAGFIVDVAHNSESAFGILSQHRPDLILMDVHLGHANGIQLIAGLRKRELFADVPVLVVTSDRTRNSLVSAIDVEIQGYILKPYDSLYLIKKIRNVLRNYRSGISDDTIDETATVGYQEEQLSNVGF